MLPPVAAIRYDIEMPYACHAAFADVAAMPPPDTPHAHADECSLLTPCHIAVLRVLPLPRRGVDMPHYDTRCRRRLLRCLPPSRPTD